MMKNTKLFLSIFFTMIIAQAFAQTNKEITANIVAEKNYVFNANSAIPLASNDINNVLSRLPGVQQGGVINLSGSQYDLKITPDSIVAYLPYYGRAYSAPYNSSESGIKFKSKDFSYQESKTKKGAYSISIKTNDLKTENYQLMLNISANGYASLSVNSHNKQSINFNGYLSEAKKKD